MTMTTEKKDSDSRLWLTGLLAAIAVLTLTDIIGDSLEGGSLTHILTEAVVALGALYGTFVTWRQHRNLRRELVATRKDMASIQQEAARWKEESHRHMQGLQDAIDAQFTRWELSGAEKEVALLLLKGLSLKEVADVRGTSERTARQQALNVYQKSGLSGRSELSAFFLEDLMLPANQQNPKDA